MPVAVAILREFEDLMVLEASDLLENINLNSNVLARTESFNAAQRKSWLEEVDQLLWRELSNSFFRKKRVIFFVLANNMSK